MKNRCRKVVLIGAVLCLLVVVGIVAALRSESGPEMTVTAKPPILNTANWVFSVRATNALIVIAEEGKLLVGDQKGKITTNLCTVQNKRSLGLGEGLEFEIAVPVDAKQIQLVVSIKAFPKSRADLDVKLKDHTPKLVHSVIKKVFKELGFSWKSVTVKSSMWGFQQESWREIPGH